MMRREGWPRSRALLSHEENAADTIKKCFDPAACLVAGKRPNNTQSTEQLQPKAADHGGPGSALLAAFASRQCRALQLEG
jgi:hypothetical protein